MFCYLCGRRLLHAAATITTAHGARHAGPSCARKAGLLPPRAARLFTVRNRRPKVNDRQGLLGLEAA